MDQEILYRDAGPDDIAALSALGRSSFFDAFGHLYSSADLNLFLETAYSPAKIASELANPDRLYRVAEFGGALVGYCKLNLKTGFADDLNADMDGRKIIDLSQLYVRSDAIGKGIGDALARWAIDVANSRGCDDVFLSVYSENYGAHRFYQRLGFAKYADTYFMVGNHRDDEYLYRLALTA